MTLARRTGRIAAWIAIFAMLLAALAPTVARAWPSAQALPWTEICSVAGTQSSAQDAAPASGSGQHEAAAFQHCPFCLTHAGQYVLPAAAFATRPAPETSLGFVPVSVATPAFRFMRVAAQPRAPPAIS